MVAAGALLTAGVALAAPDAARLPAACTAGKAAAAAQVAEMADGATIRLTDERVVTLAGVEAAASIRVDPAKLGPVLREAVSSATPTLVDIVCQPLHEARAPVSEWVA